MGEVKPNLLIVDNSKNSLFNLKRMLVDVDINVVTAMTGAVALEAINAQDFFLVLLDVNLPDMDGFETLSRIQKNELHKYLPVIFLATNRVDVSVDSGYAAGAVDYIFKPISSPHHIIAKVKIFLNLELTKQALVQATAAAENANFQKTQLMSSISHELRTPMTSIKAIFGLIEGGLLQNSTHDEVENLAAKGVKSTDRLINLVDDLLDIKKAEEGKIEYHLMSQTLAPIVEEAIHMTEEFACQNDIKLLFDIEKNKDVIVKIDSLRLIQILINLISNAIKFTSDKDDVTLSIEKNGDFTRLLVEDHGSGIPIEHQDKLFNEFFQVNPGSVNHGVKGSGLGLCLCKRMIEDMGGTIGFNSVKGEGTTFYLDMVRM